MNVFHSVMQPFNHSFLSIWFWLVQVRIAARCLMNIVMAQKRHKYLDRKNNPADAGQENYRTTMPAAGRYKWIVLHEEIIPIHRDDKFLASSFTMIFLISDTVYGIAN